MNTGTFSSNILRSATAAELLEESGITPDKTLMFCGRRATSLPAVRQLVRVSGKPFLLVGTAKELEDSCLWALNPDWLSKELGSCPADGSGFLMVPPGSDIGLLLNENPALCENRYVILCLSGLQAEKALSAVLDMPGGCIILAPSAHIN